MTGPFLSKVPTSTVTPLVFQDDCRCAVTDFQHGAGDDTAAQLVDMTLHDRLPFDGNALVSAARYSASCSFKDISWLPFWSVS